uniref:Small ribosomal subunit protein uS4c n=2 Tax=Streptophytina TaxID=131221 RepID=A0A024B4A1_9VIRI|nr:ribosomal protein S4 [Mesotaenium endlicherianum]AHZ11235.1 ribosomal protein S4 [Mesotaenium endlicherianum]
MSRYRGPRVKIIRSLGSLPGLTSKIPKIKSPHGSGSPSSLSKKGGSARGKASSGGSSSGNSNRKGSEYGVRLAEKQRLRFHYGLTEHQLFRYVRLARRAKGSTGEVLLQLLEMRLDNILFRLGMAPTIPAARQLVSHGHVLVSQRVVNIPSYRCKPDDTISIRDRQRSQTLIERGVSQEQNTKVPSHLSLKPIKGQAAVTHLVQRDFVGLKVNELLVVEYYSRQA